ncbi:MAG: class I SAM-dependent methyltransferase [Alphaproteobacteria bacterium]|nr:class I SAM-dependent methyltransferase [Alphaproteobacteria bacterium]
MTDAHNPNADQADFWNGPGGETWTTQRDRFNAMLGPIGDAAIARARPSPGEHVLDVGCGTGHTTGDLAQRVAPGGSVMGLDISELMLQEARRFNEGHAVPVRFHAADAQTHRFDDDAFDLVFSRFGVMFFEDSVAAFANLYRALKPGGRLAFACWQPVDRNAWVHVPGGIVARHIPVDGPGKDPSAPGPFALGAQDRIAEILGAAGFGDLAIEGHETLVLMGGGGSIEAAVRAVTHQGPLSRAIHDAPEETQTRIRDDLTAALADHTQDDGVRLGAGVWLVTARK